MDLDLQYILDTRQTIRRLNTPHVPIILCALLPRHSFTRAVVGCLPREVA